MHNNYLCKAYFQKYKDAQANRENDLRKIDYLFTEDQKDLKLNMDMIQDFIDESEKYLNGRDRSVQQDDHEANLI